MWSWWPRFPHADDGSALQEWGKYLDPRYYVTAEEYELLWHRIFDSVFQGDLARAGAVLSMALAFWFGAIKQRFGFGIFFYITTFLFAYGANLRLFS